MGDLMASLSFIKLVLVSDLGGFLEGSAIRRALLVTLGHSLQDPGAAVNAAQ